MRTLRLNQNDGGQRLDKFLHKYFKGSLPPSLLYKMLRKKRVKVNGRAGKADQLLREGDELCLYISDGLFPPDGAAKASAKRLLPPPDIVYEDEGLLLINKPAGLTAHAADGAGDTLMDRVLGYLTETGAYRPGEEQSFTPALCNRIDRNTSGLVAAAKTAEALRCMNEIIRDRSVRKTYLALCHGVMAKDAGRVEGYLKKDARQNKARVLPSPADGAQPAETLYRVVARGGASTLVEAELVTGRFHQIRAHMASIGHPLLGDAKYGGRAQSGFTRQALHSHRLEFLPQMKDTPLGRLCGKAFTAPPPKGFNAKLP